MLIVFGALKIEIAAVLDMMEASVMSKTGGIIFHEGKINGTDIIVVITGMGRLNAQKAVGLTVEKYLGQQYLPYSSRQRDKESIKIMAAGFCGAASKKLKAGDIVFYGSIKKIDISKPPGFKSEASLRLNNHEIICPGILGRPISFVTGGTVPQVIIQPGQKNMIYEELSVEAIDLESYWIGKKILSRGLPFYCLRSVSDGSGDRLPDYFGVFSKTRTLFKILRSCLLSIISPNEFRSNIMTVRNIKKAKSRLDRALRAAVPHFTGPVK